MPNIFAPDLFQRRRNRKLKEHDAYILHKIASRRIGPALTGPAPDDPGGADRR